MQRLTQNDFDALFSLMEKSFPADEYRDRTTQKPPLYAAVFFSIKKNQ